jgi:hypothetical protein
MGRASLPLLFDTAQPTRRWIICTLGSQRRPDGVELGQRATEILGVDPLRVEILASGGEFRQSSGPPKSRSTAHPSSNSFIAAVRPIPYRVGDTRR